MDVMNKEQAKIAEEAGACAVMALERIPADIRQSKGVARMSDPKMIKDGFWRIHPYIYFCGIFYRIVEPQTFRFNGVYWDLMVT